MLFRCIQAENRKLHRSVIWLLFLAVPMISAVYGTFNYNMNLGILKSGWYDLWTQHTLFYAMFFAKFCVIAKMALLTQAWMFFLFLTSGKFFTDLSGFPPVEIIVWLLRGVVGSLGIIGVQLLLSMVIRNFALPVLLALGGSIAGLMALNADLGLCWPYSLMLMGMNSNRREDVMAGSLVPFFLSCAVFVTISFLAANLILTKRDINA